MLGIIAPGPACPFHSCVVHEFQVLAERDGYEVIFSTAGNDLPRLREGIRRMVGRRVDGIVAVGTALTQQTVADIVRSRIPLVFVDVVQGPAEAKTIEIDYLGGIRLAVQHLAALRHRRIAFLGGPCVSSFAMDHRTCFELGMKETGLSVEPRFVFPQDHAVEDGAEALAKLAVLSEMPTAILCSSETAALGVLCGASKRGMSIPRDLSVVAIGGSWISELTVPPLTIVRIPQRNLARSAFQSLRVEEKFPIEMRERDCIVRTDLVVRASTQVVSLD